MKEIEDGIQSGFQNLLNDNQIKDKVKKGMNDTMSSITGGAKGEIKQEINNQTVTNSFKITDANFMTMR